MHGWVTMDFEINIVEETETNLKMEIPGLSHTMCNLLRKVLLADKDVTFVGYTIKHPLVPKPIFIIKTNGNKSARDALKDALNKIINLAEEFQKKFRASLAELVA